MARAWLAFTLLLFLVGAALRADEGLARRVELPGEVRSVRTRLDAAEERVRQKQWAEAVDEYQHVLEEAGDQLVPLNAADPRHCVSARRLCHLRLAALPPAARRLYQARVEGQAQKWLEQGQTGRDPRVLQRLVEELFCSRLTDQALDLLGDLAFERGRFDEAVRWWRMLAPLPSDARPGPDDTPALELRYPDPQIDVARVQAKQILALLFQGEPARFQVYLKAFREQHANAGGELAGRNGKYTETLQALGEQAAALAPPPGEDAWPTFAGAASRAHTLPRPPGRLAQLRPLDGPQWRVRLDGSTAQPGPEGTPSRVVGPSAAARTLAFYPVIAHGRVFVADARHVWAYDLTTGQPDLRYDLAADGRQRAGAVLSLPAQADLSYTLTVAEGRLYARLGSQALGPRQPNDAESFLVCLSLDPSPSTSRERWLVKADADAMRPAQFEGTPIVAQGRAFSAVSSFVGERTETAIACYDAETGALLWRKDICKTREFKEGERRFPHHLLTLAGPNVVYCSHSGAIVALDAATGQRAWAVRYPSRGAKTAAGIASPRSLAPCLAAGGRLFAAPLDHDRILCVDGETGRQLWESGPVEAVHLLGVARDRLILTTTTPRAGIRALDAATGHALRDWIQPADGSDLPTFGRGFLAGGYVFWPTRDGLRVLNQEDGEPVLLDGLGPLSPEEGLHSLGNLAAGADCLVVAGTEELSVYVPEGRLLEQRRQEAARSRVSALAQYRLGLAEADAGLGAEALESLNRAERLAVTGDQAAPLRDRAQARRHELLLEMAERARNERRWDEAASYLRLAAREEFSPTERLRALTVQADGAVARGQPARAAAVWQSVLLDSMLSRGVFTPSDDLPLLASVYATKRIDELIQAHGSHIYADYERHAAMDAANGQAAADLLERAARRYPNASAAGAAWLRLARMQQDAGRPSTAAEAYRRALRGGSSADDRGRALAGLARCYEAQQCWEAARETWQQLRYEQGDRRSAAIDPERPVRALVAQRLQELERRAPTTPRRPALALPLTRVWHTTATLDRHGFGGEFVPVGHSPHCTDPGRYLVFWHAGGIDFEEPVDASQGVAHPALGTLMCRNGETGAVSWKRPLSHSVSWVGQHADTVVAAGPDGMTSLRLADGAPRWTFEAAALASARFGSAGNDRTGPLTNLSGFLMIGARLYFMVEQRRLFAVDAESGTVLWTFWAPGARVRPLPPGGRFHARYYVGKKGILLQTTLGKRLVLDGATGRLIKEAPTTREPWPRPVLALDERRVCLVPDSNHVVLMDVTTGADIWTYTLDRWPSLSGEAAQVSATAHALLVLVARNYGYDLERLDPATGARLWRSAPVSTQPFDLESAAVDETAVYFVSRNLLRAHALDSGSLLWQQPVNGPPDRWSTLRTQSYLAAYPTRAEAGQRYPILLVDPSTGQLVQRLNFAARRSAATLLFRHGGLAVVLGRDAWGLDGRMTNDQ